MRMRDMRVKKSLARGAGRGRRVRIPTNPSEGYICLVKKIVSLSSYDDRTVDTSVISNIAFCDYGNNVNVC